MTVVLNMVSIEVQWVGHFKLFRDLENVNGIIQAFS